jgi:UDP-glucose 4-epimerase
MSKTIQNVLVTGGAGCIGLQVCNELVRRGMTPHLLDLPEQISRAEPYIPAGTKLFYGSVLDNSSLRDAVKDCQGVIHLAAYLGVRRTETNKLRCLEINVNGTQNVLDCAVQEGARKVVFASSSEVYGEPFENPVREETPTQGKTVYAVTKLTGEELVKAYAQRYPKLGWTVIRYFNTFGPFQVAQFVIPKFIRNVMEGRPPVVYGDGSQRRSYCYSGDSAWATVEALLNPAAEAETINVGNGQSLVSLTELAEAVIRVCGREGEVGIDYQPDFQRTDRAREREIFQRFCDTSKAARLLGYKPKVSLEEGLRQVLAHGTIHPKWATSDTEYTIDDWV